MLVLYLNFFCQQLLGHLLDLLEYYLILVKKYNALRSNTAILLTANSFFEILNLSGLFLTLAVTAAPIQNTEFLKYGISKSRIG
ncbi:unnamed protein product [Meloidogyne enterolobii]|uniref:Uncharacterized protein n=1 Tax=Meloidogyne enterolobii TaxID=390850 RepID=A0ACB1ACZ7_MELEN